MSMESRAQVQAGKFPPRGDLGSNPDQSFSTTLDLGGQFGGFGHRGHCQFGVLRVVGASHQYFGTLGRSRCQDLSCICTFQALRWSPRRGTLCSGNSSGNYGKPRKVYSPLSGCEYSGVFTQRRVGRLGRAISFPSQYFDIAKTGG